MPEEQERKYNGPAITPGEFPPGFGKRLGELSPYTGEISPGPSRPHFDPPIRPPSRQTGILFPLKVCWLLDSHSGQDEEIYARTDMDMGPARLRRKYTQVPHVRSAKMFVTADEAKKFHEWFEVTLGVGQLRFIAQFHDIGAGLRWFEAEFVEPWEAEFVPLAEQNKDGNAERAWKISVKVRLYGEGMLHNPLLDPNAKANFGVKFKLPLLTQNSSQVTKKFTVNFKLPLTSLYNTDSMSVNFSLPLVSELKPPDPWRVWFRTYLIGQCSAVGKNRFKVNFSLPLR